MAGSTIITDWLGYGATASIPVAATLNALLSANSTAFYYAKDTNTLYVLDRDAPAWEIVAVGGGGVSLFEDLTDVAIDTSLAINDLVSFNGTHWVNVPASSLGGTSGFVTITKTANYTVLTGDAGKRFNNIGASADIVLTLPAAVANLSHSFAVFAAHYIKLLANGTDTISLGTDTSAAGGFVRSNSPYSFISIEAHAAGGWIASSMVGAWGVDI